MLNFRSIRYGVSLILALFVLNFVLTFHNVCPTLFITTHFELSVEIAILILVLAFFIRWKRRVSPQLVTFLALLLTLLTLARYIEVTAPALFGRSVNLYWDARYLPNVARMLAEVASPILVVLIYSGALLVLAAIFFVLRLALDHVVKALGKAPEWRSLSLLMSVITLAYFMGHIPQPVHTLKYYSLPLTDTYWAQLKFIASAMGNEASELIPAQDPLTDFNLKALGGSDVVVQFIESYGASAYDIAAVAATVAPAQEDFASSIAETKRRVVSAFIDSPTFGGNSWLAHASFMTGLDINHLSTYDLLMTQQRTTLSDTFTAQGYRPVALMPGLRADWPEGAFYGFSSIYGAAEINYTGPEFGWWRIPDQYSLQRLYDLEIAKQERQPLFLLFTSITPHMPFRPTPPLQPDWSRLRTETPYDQPEVEAALALLPEWNNLQPAYAGTLAYTFQYLAAYMRQYPADDFVWILLGDHQPPAVVSGVDARWDVPVHIVTSDDTLIEKLLALGFLEGMNPANQPINSMHELVPGLLEAFSE